MIHLINQELGTNETPALPSKTVQSASELIGGSGDAPNLLRAISSARHIAPSTLTAAVLKDANQKLLKIPQKYVGELTGSVNADVHCYGYTVDKGVCIWVNMGGPRMAVEAIRAKLGRGDIVSLTPWDAPGVELTAGEGNSSKYTDIFANMQERKFTSLILLHELLAKPNYGGELAHLRPGRRRAASQLQDLRTRSQTRPDSHVSHLARLSLSGWSRRHVHPSNPKPRRTSHFRAPTRRR